MPISEVYNEDNMIGMARYPNKFFDLAIVDPPYGININMNMGRRKGRKKKHLEKQWDDNTPPKEYFSELFRVSKNQIIWGGNYFNLPPSQCFLIWDKGETMRGRDFAECEQAWASFAKSARMYKRSPIQSDRIHPTQKPISLYQWLLKNYAKTGDKILDTHLGSGSSRIAAYKMGFDFWGWEIDKDYFETSHLRFEKEIAEPLFTNIQPTQKSIF